MSTQLPAIAALLLAAFATIAQAATSSRSPIVIGATSDRTGVYARAAGLPQSRAVAVWVQWTNAKGGILGHPVIVLDRDGESIPAKGAKILAELLNDPTVIAVVHGGNDTRAGALVAKAGAAVIGALNDEELGYANTNVFSASTTADVAEDITGFIGVGSSPRQPDGGVLYAPEFNLGDAIPRIRAVARKAGGDLVYTDAMPMGVPADYAAHCLAAREKNVGWVVALHLPATIAAFAEACAKVGYQPTWLTVSGVYAPDLLKVSALDGMKIVMPNTLYDGASPAAQEFLEAVAKYDPDLLGQPYFGEYSIIAWSGMQLVAKAIEQAHARGTRITRADVYRGLYSLKGETLGGLAPPLTFRRGRPTTVSCYFVAEISGGKLITTSVAPVCP